MNDNLETRTKSTPSTQVSSMVRAAPHSALIPCKDKLKEPEMRGCDRPRKLTMPAASAVELRPLLTFLGSIDNLTLRLPSSRFSMLVTMHLTSVPGENMSGSEFNSCPATWPTEKQTIFTILNNIKLEFVTEADFENKIPEESPVSLPRLQ